MIIVHWKSFWVHSSYRLSSWWPLIDLEPPDECHVSRKTSHISPFRTLGVFLLTTFSFDYTTIVISTLSEYIWTWYFPVGALLDVFRYRYVWYFELMGIWMSSSTDPLGIWYRRGWLMWHFPERKLQSFLVGVAWRIFSEQNRFKELPEKTRIASKLQDASSQRVNGVERLISFILKAIENLKTFPL